MAPRQVGPYAVVRELGRGGMGVVYEVRHPADPRPLALKLLRRDLADDEARRRFAREGELLARLRHPGVLAVHGAGEDPAGPWLVTDLVPGEPLDDLLAARGPLPPPEAARLVRAVADAVGALHQAGLIHRDIKPANIIVRPDGQPVLLDLGIARTIGGARLTSTGALVGTPQYMAPEQASGEATDTLDARVDVWALGCVLFELLAGRRAFDSPSVVGILAQVHLKEPRWPWEDRPDIPEDLRAIVRAALAKDPADRLPSATALRDALTQVLRGRPVVVPAPRRARRALALAAAAALVVAAAALVVALRPRGAAAPLPAAASPPPPAPIPPAPAPPPDAPPPPTVAPSPPAAATWDAPFATLEVPVGAASVAFVDGELLIGTGKRLLHWAPPAPARVLGEAGARITALAAPDPARVVVGLHASDDALELANLVDPAARTEVLRVGGPVQALAVDGEDVLALVRGVVWRVDRRTSQLVPLALPPDLTALARHPDGRLAISDGSRVWTAAPGGPCSVLPGAGPDVAAIAWAGSRVVVGSVASRILLLDPAGGAGAALVDAALGDLAPRAHDELKTIAVTADAEGALVVTAAGSGATVAEPARGTVRAWRARDQALLAELGARDRYPSRLALSPDGAWLAVSTLTGVELWDTADLARRARD